MAERKTTKKEPAKPRGAARSSVNDLQRAVKSLERRLKQSNAEIEALKEKHERQLAATKRAADRRLSAFMSELTALRYHEARAQALERLVAERDALIVKLREDLTRLSGADGLDSATTGSASVQQPVGGTLHVESF
jgi:predicted RNase H-like nuclease (RuvC/YqgF family)